MNPLLSAIQGGGNNPLQSLMNLWKMSQGMANPQEYLLSELAKSNQSAEILKLLQNNNGDFVKTYYEYAKVLGKNPDEELNALKQSMGLK